MIRLDAVLAVVLTPLRTALPLRMCGQPCLVVLLQPQVTIAPAGSLVIVRPRDVGPRCPLFLELDPRVGERVFAHDRATDLQCHCGHFFFLSSLPVSFLTSVFRN